jgi:branched-chain amino acid aminotransferase
MSICVYIDGEVHSPETAKVSVFDRGFLYGDSVYETIALLDRRPVFLAEHLERLERSGNHIYLRVPERKTIEAAIRQTVAASEEDHARLRIIVTRGIGSGDLDPASACDPQLIVIVQPLRGPTAEMLESGVAVEIVGVSRGAPGNVDPAVKSGNYLASVLAVGQARRRRPGVHEAILCSANGGIAEGATSNVFAVERGVLLTPGLDVGILGGVTRAKVLRLAEEAGVPTQELGCLAPDRLRGADEVFLTSSVRGILPVTVVDGCKVGGGHPGPITGKLLARYQRLIHESP